MSPAWAASVERAAAADGVDRLPGTRGDPSPGALRDNRARDCTARWRRCRSVSRGHRAGGIRPGSGHTGQLRPARLHVVFHGRRGRVSRVVSGPRHTGTGSRRAKYIAISSAVSYAPRWSPTTPSSVAGRWQCAASVAKSAWRARSTSSRTAISSTSDLLPSGKGLMNRTRAVLSSMAPPAAHPVGTSR